MVAPSYWTWQERQNALTEYFASYCTKFFTINGSMPYERSFMIIKIVAQINMFEFIHVQRDECIMQLSFLVG
jgi:hypothetical protein